MAQGAARNRGVSKRLLALGNVNAHGSVLRDRFAAPQDEFTSAYFSESSLFNGLHAEEVKKSSAHSSPNQSIAAHSYLVSPRPEVEVRFGRREELTTGSEFRKGNAGVRHSTSLSRLCLRASPSMAAPGP
jgi:hypothetical protein